MEPYQGDERQNKCFFIILFNLKIDKIEKTILSLLKDQMQKLMLVSANNDYVFKQIEPPIIPENTSSLSVIVITIFGFIFGLWGCDGFGRWRLP